MLQSLDDVSEETWVTHRNTYRGKNLGSEVTEEQIAHIHDGSFKDLYVGDYWEINGTRYTIADFNYIDSYDLPNNHLVIVADNSNWISKWNNTRSTQNGYAGSYIKTTTLPNIKQQIVNDLPTGVILGYKAWSSNGYNPTSLLTTRVVADYDVDLMNQMMVFGNTAPIDYRNTTDILDISIILGNLVRKFKIFDLNPEFIYNKSSFSAESTNTDRYWLNGVSSATSAPNCTRAWSLAHGYVDESHLVRPYFCIG